MQKQETVRMAENVVQAADMKYNDYEDIFIIDTSDENENKIWCVIGGVEVNIVVDSGTRFNIVDRESWDDLKAKNIVTNMRKRQVDIGFKSYGGYALSFIGMFEATIKVGQEQTNANFYVANEVGKMLLGYQTAKILKVLKIGQDVQDVNNVEAAVKSELGKIKGIMIEIPMNGNVKAVQQPYRRIPVPLEKIVDEKISDMLARGIIEKVNTSKWISPLVITPKPDGDVRVNVDMRRVNEGVEREHHPLPTIEDFMPELKSAKVFSKLDVKDTFHQLEISPDSREITTFITRRGLFRYKRLMFGINCAPEIFQRTMENILKGCEGCINFIDDILVYGGSQEEHDKRLQNILRRMKEYNVTLNEKKCTIGVKEIDFLGHHLSENGIQPTADKIAAVKQFRAPISAEETRSFLGLVNYMGKFIPDLATVSEPLRRLTKKDMAFDWKSEQQAAFEKLKWYLSQENTLGYYDVKDKTRIIADASPVGLGAVLIQYKGSEPRIISYASHSLSKTERKYSQPEKEAMALVWATERFYFYVYGREFELETDHKYLETIFGPRSKPCARIERWSLRLMSYKFKVIYRPGKSNIADPLSRLLPDTNSESLSKSEIETEDEVYINWIITHAEQMQLAHEGHPGMAVMKKRLRAKVWWPKMDDQIEAFVKKCKGCTLVSAPSGPEPMRRRELPAAAWEHIAIDFCGPLPSGHNLLVLVDYYSRYVEVEVMTKADAQETIKRLRKIFARFGFPLSMQADNGPQFISQEFEDYCERNNIHLNHGIPYWPQQNGEVERQNRSLLKRIKISQQEKSDWLEDLQEYLLMYRSTPHTVTLKTPSEMMFTWNIRDKLPTMKEVRINDESVRDRDKEEKGKGKEYGDRIRNAKSNEIQEGDEVILKRQKMTNKLSTTFEPTTFKVVDRSGSEITVENPETSTQYRRNVAHVKKIPQGGFEKQPTTEQKLKTPEQPNDSPNQSLMPTDTGICGSRPKRTRTAPQRYN